MLLEQAKKHPGMPSTVDQLLAELNVRSGVAATVDEPKRQGDDPSLLLYGTNWVLRLFPTARRDGYVIASIVPLRIRDHHQLARRCLVVRPPRWQRVFEVRMLPAGAESHWERLLAEWVGFGRHSAALGQPPNPAHTRFLDDVGALVEANQRITMSEARREIPFPYRKVGPIGERRHGTASTYEFVMTDERAPEQDAFVQVRGEPEQRGQVTRVDGRGVLVRFDQPVDFQHIEQVGALELTPSTVVFDKQREAVALLRDGQSLNPHLLAAFVDHRVLPITETPARPARQLDADQLVAFRKMLAVPDVLLVLGPPGTGKTRVITQGAEAAARARQRVLITSHTNRAVDNVLPRLPAELVVVRVGNEGAVTDDGRPYLLENLAVELRQVILNQTGQTLDRVGDLDVASKWTGELADRAAALAAALDAEERSLARLRQAQRAAGSALVSIVDSLAAQDVKLSRKRAELTRAVERYGRWRTALGGLFAPFCDKRAHSLRLRSAELSELLRRQEHERAEAERQLEEVTREAPAVRAAHAELATYAERVTEARAHAVAAAHALRAAVAALDVPPEVRDDTDLHALVAWAGERIPLLRGRVRLLGEWREQVAGATRQLHPELIRYADVIACTAIGAASRAELSDVDFDLAVVDEAGQIGMADALVPLVRARRAVLVGDHQQLPPFLDSEVEAWGDEVGTHEVRAMLAKSALELAFDGFPAANVVPLRQQRRMPASIADFISQEFYGGTLRTAVQREHSDPVFRDPFAFVDTSGLRRSAREEKPAEEPDRGVHNPAEARLLARLAEFYEERGAEWAVIVPYRAQVRAISTALLAVLVDERKVRLNVGTVDSFQGGERDVILYGCTRSNPDGHIGFLRELRRTNVAFTRAKQQLVLVGDLGTLTKARDEAFREFAIRLRDHLARHGDIRQYDEIIGTLG